MKKIEIYSTPTCQYCHLAKDFLKEKGVSFSDYNVAEDAEKRQQMIEMSGQMGVPVIVVSDDSGDDDSDANDPQIMVGFDEGKLAEMAGIE